jgi:putative FmdB family regulatory protein
MPLYDYRCKQCGERFEVIQKFSDEPLTVHEKCGGEVERLISPSALQFKGTGWYVTDYAKKNGNSKSDENRSKSSSEGKSTEKKVETKPAPAKTE